MLLKNDVLALDGGELHRVLAIEPQADRAWTIALGEKHALPRSVRLFFLNESAQPHRPEARCAEFDAPSKAQREARERAMKAIEPLLVYAPAIFDPATRGPLLREHARKTGISKESLLKYLRRFWQGGQTPDALLARYDRCGSGNRGLTAGRGRKYIAPHVSTYQLEQSDIEKIREAVKKGYLADECCTVSAAYESMVEDHYMFIDGNGDKQVLSTGNRPSLRQFRYALAKHFGLEEVMRARKGDKAYERDHRPKLGTVLDDCLGPGHMYEIDATIADIYLVSSVDPSKIIGKPTLYLIIDRNTRLIVAWYAGLESASWVGAMQAILQISMDKAETCRRLGVEYDPDEWPAHEIFPQQFVGDRGEMLSNNSTLLCSGLRVTVINVPSERPDWKPIVECGFKLVHQTLATNTLGYDPPRNAKKRRGKNYEKDACLTLADFNRLIAEAVIKHNRSPMLGFQLELDEETGNVEPSPLALWDRRVLTRSGQLSRVAEKTVRYELLPRDKASVTGEGVHFKDCFYTCPEAMDRGWFVNARKKGLKVQVSYDSRDVERLYVQDPIEPRRYFVATLLEKSRRYAAHSFAEVQYYEWLSKVKLPDTVDKRLEESIRHRQREKPTTDKGKKVLAAIGKTSRSARREDTAAERKAELQRERDETVVALPRGDSDAAAAATPSGNVLHFRPQEVGPGTNGPHVAPQSCEVPARPQPSSETPHQAAVRRAREVMLNG